MGITRKKINGKVVNIPNMGLFEKAFEGLALGRLVSSSVADTISDNSDLVNECIHHYETAYRSLPFPLYACETDIKYSTLGMYIRDKMEDKALDMWIENALFIDIGSNKALKLVGNTWGIVPIANKLNDNIDLDQYRDEEGYNEYEWALAKLMRGESVSKGYYERFLGEFVDACNKENMLIKWELSHMLDFGPIPERLALKDNRLLDVDTDAEYFLDIFSTGKRKTGESEYVFSIGTDSGVLRKQNKYVKTYDFEVYEKKAQSNDIMLETNISRIQKCGLDGAAAIFETLAGKGSINDGIENVSYTGIIAEGNIIYQVGSQIYKCKANKYTKAIEIARNVELYGYDKGFVYIIKKSLCSSGVTKEAIYAYNIADGSLRLCKVQFN